jgi:hypothetical protein
MDSPSLESPQGSEPIFDIVETHASHAPRGFAWLAWLVIILTIGLMIFPHLWLHQDDDQDPSVILFEIQARYLVGASSLSIQGNAGL